MTKATSLREMSVDELDAALLALSRQRRSAEDLGAVERSIVLIKNEFRRRGL